MSYNSSLATTLDLAKEVAERYDLDALSGLLAQARALAGGAEISVAVLGRFKVGKSSFLNHFLGRDFLPVGVVPVTTVVTAVRFGDREEARVHHRDGRDPEIPLDRIGSFISEKENPENAKEVSLVTVELPELRRFRGLQFVDTPGLDSALSHNTLTSLAWLPHAGLALVAVSVDPPLSQRDIDLLKSLYRYTPKVAVLLTKADLLSEQELKDVIRYVRAQLTRNFPGKPHVFPYSTKPGFERFREALEAELAGETLEHFAAERESILMRKMDTLLRELNDYLALSLKSAEMLQSGRQELNEQVFGEKEALEDVKAVIGLLMQNAAAEARADIDRRLEGYQGEVERALFAAFETEFPQWTSSLATMRRSFEDWLASALRDELTALSDRHRDSLLEPLRQVREQTFRVLQQFRDRLSDSAMRGFGVPLRTTEAEIGAVEPTTPNVRVGRVFDRNWELLSPILPAFAVEAAVRRHFVRTIPLLVEQNLSRLGLQWEESVNAALRIVEKEANRRLDELMTTVERLVGSGNKKRTPQLRADLERIETARKSLFPEAAKSLVAGAAG
ncbi:MAG: dynamin family protein [Bryobacteraceae bacterium]|jgi:GTP-binding protein EngB required for normal cell division